MSRFYVCIEGIPREVLEFLGYSFVRSNSEFELIADYSGNEHIVNRKGPRFIFVDDVNDAHYLKGCRMVAAPDPDL
jgi:hypothetical protein